jgi:hypothetical protein
MAQPGKTPAEWAAIAELSGEACEIAAPAANPHAFAEALAREARHADAVRLLAHLLPNREAVLWAWSCAKGSTSADPPPRFTASLHATEKWIAQPNDDNRRTAMAAAQEAGLGTPAGAAGLAAFLSGASIAPAGAHPVPPAEFQASKAVAAAVMLSAVAAQPEKAPTKYSDFVMRGFEVASRIHLWERITGPSGKDS